MFVAMTVALLLGGVSVPSAALAPKIRFEAENLSFLHFGASRAALLPEDNGSGVAIGDYDNDGYDDVYIVNLAGPVLMAREELVASRPPGRLFHNRGDGSFEDVTDATELKHVGWGMGAVWADVNDDGWLDLIVTGIDEVRLYLSQKGTRFTDASVEFGLGELPCFATGLALADYDGDLDLDLYVPCYVAFPWERARSRPLVGGRPSTMTTPADYPAQRNYLFRNDGGKRFSDVTNEAGVGDPDGRGLQVLFADLNADGLPDLYIANDQSFDKLYLNRGDGSFVDVSAEAGTRDPRAGMGIAFGDYDGDGVEDLFLTHWVGEQNALYRNLSTQDYLLFEDVTYPMGLAPVDQAWVGWGSSLFDVELDGDLDLLVVNGSTIEDEWTLEVLTDPKMIPQPLRIYEQREGRFVDVSAAAGEVFSELIVGRGAAFGDFDRDGLVDAVVSVHNGAPLILRNSSEPRGNWLAIELEGRSPNRFAAGAKVEVRIDATHKLTRQLLVGESYLSDNSYRLHFGLGKAATVTVTVWWPSGEMQTFKGVPTDVTIRLRQGAERWDTVPAGRRTPRPWGVNENREEQIGTG